MDVKWHLLVLICVLLETDDVDYFLCISISHLHIFSIEMTLVFLSCITFFVLDLYALSVSVGS